MPIPGRDPFLHPPAGVEQPEQLQQIGSAGSEVPKGQQEKEHPSENSLESDGELKNISSGQSFSAGSEGSGVSSGEIWLEGGVLACACPGCGAPMSIRLWLRVADCWRCGTSIELTEEQEQAAWRLLRACQSRGPTSPSGSRSRLPQAPPPSLVLLHSTPPEGKAKPNSSSFFSGDYAPPFKKPGLPEPPRDRSPYPSSDRDIPGSEKPSEAPSAKTHFFVGSEPRPKEGTGALPPVRRRIPAAERAFRQRLRQAQYGRPWHQRVQDWLQHLPAWLISFFLHMVALLLLGLWVPGGEEQPRIVLSTSIGPYDLESELGYQPEIESVRPEFDQGGLLFEAVSAEDLLGDPSLEKELMDPGLDRPDWSLRPPDGLVDVPAPALQPGSLFRGRDPTVRNQILYSEGGTSATEAAVGRALRWISRHQNPDGSFSLHAFHRTAECQGQCSGAGTESTIAGTALALLPMLGAGHTHRHGKYASVVRAGLEWLLARQQPDGDLREPGVGQMYAHGLASIVLCEAYALTGDGQLREAAQRAVNFIVQAQHPAGGWRYQPAQAGDTSMVGWQLMALNSARMAGLKVPTQTLLKASQYLDSAQADHQGGKYGYQPGHRATPAMTAEALLCRQYLGWPRNHPGLEEGIRFLLNRHLPNPSNTNIYYWYYATQVFHHYGGAEWRRWNAQLRRILVDSQVKTGHAAGSWDPDSEWGRVGGRLYQTALAACTLEVYYRYLPLYRAQAVEASLLTPEKSPH